MGRNIGERIFPRRSGFDYNRTARSHKPFFSSARLRSGGRAIRFRVLGCAGGKTPGLDLTSFLINESLLVEGGSAASGLAIKEQAALAGVVISHAHLDHVAELPYVAENVFGLREDSLPIIGAAAVLNQVRESIFNDAVWPDFSAIRHRGKPILEFVAIEENETQSRGGIRITPRAVAHKTTAFGFIFEDAEGALLYTGDTGPTEAIWEKGREAENLRAIITEVSFPDKMQELARLTMHMTPAILRAEIGKMPPQVPVYLYHLKAQWREEIIGEIEALNEPRIRVLEQGQTYDL